ncbi:MAG: aminoacetone oxidase family FAD-binding enzyme [Deltaproteobacteria bacterium HGW-Deltaproteobacteria-4]|nr:MAG: aminoacetone oxidase family FAD-binding enzyme [Deltaproteobacteria bacterium HGW-Deltaproteobacteria-4]
MNKVDVIIIGAGASGLFCAMEAARRGRQVIVFDHAASPGRKILASGGGRCNFTNYEVDAAHFLGANPHFCKSALNRYNQWNFLELVNKYKIRFHEREHGQLFCDQSASEILAMLLDQCHKTGVHILTSQSITDITKSGEGEFVVSADLVDYAAASLVIASGGLSMSNLGASDLGYQLAKKFGHSIVATRPGLVPLTLSAQDKELLTPLSGIAIPATVTCRKVSFTENLLFTHRGLSGPVILQISNYWHPGDPITIDLLPGSDLLAELKEAKKSRPQRQLKSLLQKKLPNRLVTTLLSEELLSRPLQIIAQDDLVPVCQQLQQWTLRPAGSEGYKSAEVTVGGVNTAEVSSKTMESRKVAGLYFVGEVLDVTGWLGGYNLQWAWSSGWCAGQYV